VAVIQRLGGRLNLSVHVHVLALDGVFARTAAGALTLHPTRRPHGPGRRRGVGHCGAAHHAPG
jgi:hypothetical protein